MTSHTDHIADLLDRVAALDDAPDRSRREWFYTDLAHHAEDACADVAALAREEGYAAGHQDGYQRGHRDGFRRGMVERRRHDRNTAGPVAPMRTHTSGRRHSSARPSHDDRGGIA